MKRYEKNKESNDVWLGRVPSDWKISSLKHFVEIINGYAFKSEDYSNEVGVPIIRIGDIYSPVDVKNAKKANPENLSELDRFLIKRGDLLLAMTGATIGKNCIFDSDEIAFVNQRVGLLRGKGLLSQSFLKFYLDTPLFREFISLTCSGSAQENISSSQVAAIKFALPSVVEQTQIARFLDCQTGVIDDLIKQKEKLIELLKEKRQALINEAVTKGLDPKAKMKDSGIKGIGKIPEHWEITRLKQITDAYGRIGYRGYTTSDIVSEGEGAITISPSNMKGDFMTFENSTYISWSKYDESPEIQVFNDDVLMVKTGSTYGKVGLVKNLDERATINPQLIVFKNTRISSDYLYNLMRTPIIQNQVETTVIGSTIPTISQTKILNYEIVLPPINEIADILNYINKTMNKIDVINSGIKIQIERLKEYRQAIISEAVTGKIDVRDWQPKKLEVA